MNANSPTRRSPLVARLVAQVLIVTVAISLGFVIGRIYSREEIKNARASAAQAYEAYRQLEQSSIDSTNQMLRLLPRNPIEEGMKADEWEFHNRIQRDMQLEIQPH